jgi:transcriptional regulator with XRE-family HTH domain
MVKKSSQTTGTLGWLETVYCESDAATAQDRFKQLYPSAAYEPYFLYRPGEGQSVVRTDVDVEDGITYENYSPPAFWGAPYQILKLRMEWVEQPSFIYHGGEELLLPISGEIPYHFFWHNPPAGWKKPQTHEIEPLKRGSIIRINPELPHHAWAGGKEKNAIAHAWMVIRHVSNAGTSITLNTPHKGKELHPAPRRVKASDFKDPGRFALIAWGLSEKIRLQRDQSKLSIAQVAAHCEIDASHLSRIERADTNVSLDTLLRVCRFLGIDLSELIAPEPWAFQLGSLSLPKKPESPFFSRPLPPPPGHEQATRQYKISHFLHPVYWELKQGETLDKTVFKKTKINSGFNSSWIVLEGQAIMEIPTESNNVSVLTDEDGVAHLRGLFPNKIQAIQKSRLLQIVYAGNCFCQPPPEE